MNNNSAYMWHKHLGHIFTKRLERLVNNEIILNLDVIALRESKPNITKKSHKRHLAF